MVINFEFPDENLETGDEDDHYETIVSEDILETSHNHNVTLTDPTASLLMAPGKPVNLHIVFIVFLHFSYF